MKTLFENTPAGEILVADPGTDCAPSTSLGFIPARLDVYIDRKGNRRRLLRLEKRIPNTDLPLRAFLIDLGPSAANSLPYDMSRGEFLAKLQSEWRKELPALKGKQLPKQPKTSTATQAEEARRWKVFTRVITPTEDPDLAGRSLFSDLRLLYRPGRKKLLLKYEAVLKITAKTLLHYLRDAWKGGMTSNALRPNYEARGEDQQALGDEVLLSRKAPGRQREDGQPTYRLTKASKDQIVKAALAYLAADRRHTIAGAYKELAEKKWLTIDANGEVQLLPIGQMPSLQQVYRLLRKHRKRFDEERRQAGPGHFENNFAGNTGFVLQEAVCAGHQYEVDSTQADVWLVSAENRNKIIGKPTLYFIIDRFSRLIVGWHATLDSPCWHGACEAFLSIFEDPQLLCSELGVKFRPEAHPGVGLAPSELVADRGGEYVCEMSGALAQWLNVSVINLPAHMCKGKGTVECTFRQTHVTLQDVAPGYQPPAEAMKRHGADYEHDAQWTLDEFRAQIMEFVYLHNLKVHSEMPMRLHLRDAGVRAIPAEVFKHDAAEASGMLSSLDPAAVYWELLARKRAVVTNSGVVLHGLEYSCPEIEELDWLVRGGQKRFPVQARYDRRLSDQIYVLNPDVPGTFFVCKLTPAYQMYGRRSFAEAQRALKFIKPQKADAERYNLRLKLQIEYDARGRVERAAKLAADVIARAKTIHESRTSGRVDIRDQEARERSVELADQRHQSLTQASDAPAPPPAPASGQPAESPAPFQTQSSSAAVADALDLIIVKNPLKALRDKGH